MRLKVLKSLRSLKDLTRSLRVNFTELAVVASFSHTFLQQNKLDLTGTRQKEDARQPGLKGLKYLKSFTRIQQSIYRDSGVAPFSRILLQKNKLDLPGTRQKEDASQPGFEGFEIFEEFYPDSTVNLPGFGCCAFQSHLAAKG